MRLGIRCDVSRPSFEFVNGPTSAFRDRNGSRRWIVQTRHSRVGGHVPTSDRRDSSTPTISAPMDENCITAMQSTLVSAQEESVHVDKYFADGAESVNTDFEPSLLLSQSTGSQLGRKRLIALQNPKAVKPANGPTYLLTGSNPVLSLSSSTDTATPREKSDVTDADVPLLEAWFSSFVDLNVPDPNRLEYDSFADWERHKAEKGDKFYELAEKLYLNHWRNHLLRILPAPYAHVESLVGECSALRPAIIALSAYDLAETQTEMRSRMVGPVKEWFYAPNGEHQRCGSVYYNIARRELAEMELGNGDKISVLATLLLFVLIESHFGSFRAAAFHLHVVEHLLCSDHSICERASTGRGLTNVWITLRAQNWSRRIPFTLFDFQTSLMEIGVDVNRMLDVSESPAEVVIVIMFQSWRLSLMLLFERYSGRGDMESISSQCCRDVHSRMRPSAMTQPWTPKVPIPDEKYDNLLDKQRRKLDEWRTALPLSYLPIDSSRSKSVARRLLKFDYSDVSESCLEFESHEAAMAYAYYVTAKIIQSSEVMDEFLSMPPLADAPNPGRSEINHWLLTLLRIIAGLDIMTCVQRNFYSVGLLEIVRMCQLRLPKCNAILRRLTDHLVEELTDHCIVSDGSILISNFNQDSWEIEEQRIQDRDLFYIMPRFSPDAKIQPDYVHAPAPPTIAYGRDRTTGKLFCGYLP